MSRGRVRSLKHPFMSKPATNTLLEGRELILGGLFATTGFSTMMLNTDRNLSGLRLMLAWHQSGDDEWTFEGYAELTDEGQIPVYGDIANRKQFPEGEKYFRLYCRDDTSEDVDDDTIVTGLFEADSFEQAVAHAELLIADYIAAPPSDLRGCYPTESILAKRLAQLESALTPPEAPDTAGVSAPGAA